MAKNLSEFRNKCLEILSKTNFKESIVEVKQSLLVDKKGEVRNEFSVYVSTDIFTADLIKAHDNSIERCIKRLEFEVEMLSVK